MMTPAGPRGRGSAVNPDNRFDAFHLDFEPEELAEREYPTEFFRDDTQSILSKNNSEDLSFEASINPYRGCEHGCAYCYARTYHEYLGYSAGIDFESKILVKERAAELLEKQLSSPRYRCKVLVMSGATDSYQPVERKLKITRACLEVLARFRNPVVVITKNDLVTRDLDHLGELAKFGAVAVFSSITSLDPKLARILEPRASSPRSRLKAIGRLAEAGVPVGVSAAPIIPGLNDHELPRILEAAAKAGATFAFYTMVRLPGAVGPVFENWLERHFPERKDKVLARIRETHGGELNSTTPRERMRGVGALAEQLRQIFNVTARRVGLKSGPSAPRTDHFRRVLPGQGELF